MKFQDCQHMKNKEIKTVVPKLRFPEFQETEEWDVKPLAKIAYVVAGQSPEGSNYNDIGVGIPFYQGKTDFGEIFLNFPTKWTTKVTKTANEGDILMSVRAPVGALNISTNEICIGRGLAAIQPYQNKWFLYYFLSSIKNSIIGNGGSVFDSINKDQIEKIRILIPKNPKEQQKIADCLSSIDDLITSTVKKIESLKTHKKGLIQQLFPIKGKKIPVIRFPEFQNAGEWKEEKIKKLCKIGNGKDYKHLNKGNIPVYGSGGYMTSVDDFLYDGESVCIGRKGTIDKPMFLTGKFWTVDTLFYTHSFHYCLPKFLYLIFQQIDWYKYNEAGGVPSLSKATIGEINIFIPVDKNGKQKEQQKIANCLSSLDELITALTQKLETLKTHKKGLMQQLFPDMTE